MFKVEDQRSSRSIGRLAEWRYTASYFRLCHSRSHKHIVSPEPGSAHVDPDAMRFQLARERQTYELTPLAVLKISGLAPQEVVNSVWQDAEVRNQRIRSNAFLREIHRRMCVVGIFLDGHSALATAA